MARFAAGETQLLVATTVIEVGVDVPAATVMVIEHAERFGSRSFTSCAAASAAAAAARPACCSTARRSARPRRRGSRSCARPRTASASPKRICALRGEGDLLGTRQSGDAGLPHRRIEVHGKLIAAARDDAALTLSRDPDLASPRGQALRALLYLFERDEAIRLLRAG